MKACETMNGIVSSQKQNIFEKTKTKIKQRQNLKLYSKKNVYNWSDRSLSIGEEDLEDFSFLNCFSFSIESIADSQYFPIEILSSFSISFNLEEL